MQNSGMATKWNILPNILTVLCTGVNYATPGILRCEEANMWAGINLPQVQLQTNDETR